MQDVCVIGAGIVGASVAFHLSRYADVRVSMVDAGHPGAATTEAGTGWIGARSTSDPQHRELKLLAMEEHHRLAEVLPSSSWLKAGGALQAEDTVDDFEALVDDCGATGYPVEVLDAARVNAELEPDVTFGRPDLRVAWFPEEFGVAGSSLARMLFDAAIDNGAIGHLGARVTGLEQQAGGRHRIALDDGTALTADAVVNAAGAKADDIAAFYGIPMPMRPQPGIGIRVRVEGSPLGRLVWVKDLVAKPESDGVLRLRCLLGWRSTSGVAGRDGSFTGGMPLDQFVAHVVGQAEQRFPTAGPIRPIATMTGVRPFPADGLPRVGEVESVPGYFDAVTHNGGVLGPLVGRLLAEEITTGGTSPVLAGYRPDRFIDPQPASGNDGRAAAGRTR